MNSPQAFPNSPVPTGPPSGHSGAPRSTPSWMPQEPAPTGNRGRNTALIVLALVAVGGAAAVGLLVMSDKDDAKSVQSQSTEAQQPVDDVLESVPVVVSTPTIPEIPVATIAPDPNSVPPVELAPTTLFSGTRAAEVIAEISFARGASPLRMLSAYLYPEYAFAQVQDPAVPANVDEYQWRGTLSGPTPVRLTGAGALEDSLFSDTEVNWAAIPALVAAALAQIPIEGAEVTHIAIQRNLPFDDAIRIRVFVNGTRTSGYLDADGQGTVLNVSQG